MSNKGFTLIEMMIVTSIIGVVAAIAIPMYQIYMIRTKITIGLQDIASGKISYELLVNQNYGGVVDPTVLNLPITTKYCHLSINLPNSTGLAEKAIRCKLHSIEVINDNAEIYFTRTNIGAYSCHTENVTERFIPKNCD